MKRWNKFNSTFKKKDQSKLIQQGNSWKVNTLQNSNKRHMQKAGRFLRLNGKTPEEMKYDIQNIFSYWLSKYQKEHRKAEFLSSVNYLIEQKYSLSQVYLLSTKIPEISGQQFLRKIKQQDKEAYLWKEIRYKKLFSKTFPSQFIPFEHKKRFSAILKKISQMDQFDGTDACLEKSIAGNQIILINKGLLQKTMLTTFLGAENLTFDCHPRTLADKRVIKSLAQMMDSFIDEDVHKRNRKKINNDENCNK